MIHKIKYCDDTLTRLFCYECEDVSVKNINIISYNLVHKNIYSICFAQMRNFSRLLYISIKERVENDS